MTRIAVLLACCLLVACAPVQPPRGARTPEGAALTKAIEAEATDPLAADPYLDAIDAAVAEPSKPQSLAVVLAALDALVWRELAYMPPGVEHAIVHRAPQALRVTTSRLRS